MPNLKPLAILVLFATAAQATHAVKRPVPEANEDDREDTSLCPVPADVQEVVNRAALFRRQLDPILAERVAWEAQWGPAKRELARGVEFDADRADVAAQQKNLESKRAELAALKPGWFGRAPREQSRLQAQVDEALAAYQAAGERFDARVAARLPAAAQAKLHEVQGRLFDANVEASVAESQLNTMKKFGCL